MTRHQNAKLIALLSAWALVTLSVAACSEKSHGADRDSGSPPKGDGGTLPETDGGGGTDKLPKGVTDFVSADGVQGQSSADRSNGTGGAAAFEAVPTAKEGSSAADQRTVEEGDIYKVLGDDKILNLNSYRGLQVIDFSDVSKPAIIGRLAVSGYPVEMYVVDNKAIVLMNNWTGYYGSREDVRVDKKEGGLVLLVDLSDLTQPKALDQAYVPGYIDTSRLTRGGGQAALYVAANNWDNNSTTVVKSFDVSGNTIISRTQLDLGGYVQAIQATTEALLVARMDSTGADNRSRVTIVDISDPAGTMIQGDEVIVAGMVNNKFNMDLYNGVLRIASGASWDASNTNHVQTYSASDISNLVELDHCSFSDGMQLYATLFLENKAFFVTYLRKDPFHAFSIGDDGKCQEQSQFVVSGWNDFFKPVADDQRLIGVGKNDQSEPDGGVITGSTVAVSLYDITNLSNPNPLLARAEVALDQSWSEANWDDKAFSVLENALSPQAANGETGLVLLPFQGWSENDQKYVAAVQIFTFSESTLTRRGVMDHGTEVCRSFLADAQTTANMSDVEMSFFDHTAPDSPKELGRVDLAPDYTQVLTFGDYTVRLKNTAAYYSWWGSRATRPNNSFAEVISGADNPDIAAALNRIEVSANAYLVKSGKYLVAVDTKSVTDATGSTTTYLTVIDVYDMTNPPAPAKVGTVTTDKLQPSYTYYGGYYGDGFVGPMVDCLDCGGWWGGYGQPNVQVVDGAVVFVQTEWQEKLLGKQRNCSRYAANYGISSITRTPDGTCSTSNPYGGSINCTSVNGGAEVCTGEITLCDFNSDCAWCCEPVDENSVTLTEECYDNDYIRYWDSYSLYVLDLTGPKPQLTDEIQLPVEDEGVSVVADGSSVYYSYKLPYAVKGDPNPHVRYYYVEIDLSAPSAPRLMNPVNVPGELLAVQGDIIYTQDVLWGPSVAESAINKLQVKDGLAYRQASYLFANEIVDTVKLDGTGHVLVSHQPGYNYYNSCSTDVTDQTTKLTILDAAKLSVLSEVDVDSWATFRAAQAGRALFEVSGGILIMNVKDPAAPYAQAYFATPGWPQDILFEGNDILIAAGNYGIYRFDARASNLLPSSTLPP